ncbi:hypothetical protein TDB9533_01624 [Thalassocella blandensis]|nr:hypothetical protein TDB9533_01624 [Thalassocella blandensis]
MLVKSQVYQFLLLAVILLWLVLIPFVVMSGLSGSWVMTLQSWPFIVFVFTTISLSVAIGVADIEWVDVELEG